MGSGITRALALVAMVMHSPAVPSAYAAVCSLDADCDDGIECNGVETCGLDGICRDGIGLCDSLAQLHGRSVAASSDYGAAYHRALAFDGLNSAASSWCSLRTDTSPWISIRWPLGIEIAQVNFTNSWITNSILDGSFRLLDRDGVVLHDSGVVAFSAGAAVVPVVPPVRGVRTLMIEIASWAGREPCIGDVEIIGAVPCNSHADCEFSSPCLAAGICSESGSCTAAEGYCRNVGLSAVSSVSSSDYTAAYGAENAVDGTNTTAQSWCAAETDPAPSLQVELANPRPLSMLVLRNPWAANHIDEARLIVEDELGLGVYELPEALLESGETTQVFDPPVVRASQVRIEANEFDLGPCIGELELYSEYCSISLTGTDPALLRFHPGTPEPKFDLRFGKLSELKSDRDFSRSSCLLSSTQAQASLPLPTPDPGDGFYVLGRGLNLCQADGYGFSWGDSDPRVALAAFPACP